MSPGQIDMAEAVIGCSQTTLPITYLGMPLTVSKPDKGDFMPLIEKLERKLQGWKGKILSRGGRWQLVNSVLSAVPTYFMTYFKLPCWVLDRIDRIRRQFLWGKNEAHSHGMSLINWDAVILPKEWGGLGIKDLKIQNLALLLRWWWTAITKPTAMWTVMIVRLKRQENGIIMGPFFWDERGSFFWQQLQKIKPLFNWSAYWIVGDGRQIAFWYDSWRGLPVIQPTDPSPDYPRISLRDAQPMLHLLTEENIEIQLHHEEEDCLYWRWDSRGCYSTKSVYMAMCSGGKIKWRFPEIWKCKVPPTVQIFSFLMLRGKLLTQDNLAVRNIQCERGCVLCENCPIESILHLFYLCPFSVRVWYEVGCRLGCKLMVPDITVQRIWDKSWHALSSTNRMAKVEWALWVLCVCWQLWKHRNDRIFKNKRADALQVVERVLQEGRLWMKYC